MALCLTTVFAAQAADEIYAVWDASTTTLTLRYDDQREANSGVTDWSVYKDDATNVVLEISMQNALPESTEEWFLGFEKLTEFQHLDYLNTSEVTDMNSMFDECYALQSLDLSSFNTEKVTNMGWMFNECCALQSLDLSSFNTEKVTDMGCMFSGCESLTSIYFGASFNTANVTNMSYMFSACGSLPSLDLSSFKTDKVTRMEGVFSGCHSLSSLDLSSFKTDKVTTMESMFYHCYALTTIYWNENLSERSGLTSTKMFDGCGNLKGGNGTPFDAGHIDAAYAHLDEVGNPGYFTKKTATSMDNVQGDKVQGTKVLRDGQIYILRDGKMYNVMGVEIR